MRLKIVERDFDEGGRELLTYCDIYQLETIIVIACNLNASS